MTPAQIKEHCKLSPAAEKELRDAFDALSLSARAYDKVLRVARTIADLAGSPSVEAEHVAQAVQLRSLDRQLP